MDVLPMLSGFLRLEKSNVAKHDQVNAMLACRVLSNALALKDNGPLFVKHFSEVFNSLNIGKFER
jgi:hypothetical protein